MKRIIAFLFVISLCQLTVFGQKKYEMVVEKTDGSETVFNVEDIARTYFRERNDGGGDTDRYTSCPDGDHPHMIDLGLPSGTRWACCNVGATTPEGYGEYYRWGETTPFAEGDTEETYPYMGVDLGDNIAGTQYDAAMANWGTPWRMPTYEQIQELLDNCTYTWTEQNGVNGGEFTGPNGGVIFLPAAGYRYTSGGTAIYDVGSGGHCWSSSADSDTGARTLHFNGTYFYWDYGYRACGFSVRPVAK